MGSEVQKYLASASKKFNFLKLVAVQRLLWVGIALMLIGLFTKMTWELNEDEKLEPLDRKVLIFISQQRVQSLNGPAVDLTALGSPTVLSFFSVVGVVVLLIRKNIRGALYLGIGSGGAGVFTFILKNLFTRIRPNVVPRLVEVTGYSYPSGHSLASTSFYLLITFLVWKYFVTWQSKIALLTISLILIGGICLSRIYLGVHYPTDVMSGALLGAAWACLLTAVFSRHSRSGSTQFI